uniref:Small ribosomal subunit protein uS15c n=1 Tax=Passiflora xishuangbannaensis TaxID=378239 RepID=A0A8A2H8E7_9ROSI|nr:ribosomal protein S15 [Passiflora xishuangbannaensis]QSV37402.1 ribosomal protein S15 [Passiflora xishuangbannaensis]
MVKKKVKKNSLIISKKKKKNTGSVEFQIISFTKKIRALVPHFELHKKDYSSQRGLRKILEKRRRLLSYLEKKNVLRYQRLISKLDIRESKRQ